MTNLVDGTGLVLNSYSYDAFGDTVTYTETVANRFRYAGEQFDKVTGQYYLRARHYQPSIGRFVQEDTYRGEIGNPQSLNLYAYVTNNPITYADPTGHMNYRTQWDDLLLGYGRRIHDIKVEIDPSNMDIYDYISSIKSTIGFYKSLYELGKDLYNGDISKDELLEILGDAVKGAAIDAVIGDILYVKDNYEILKCDTDATDDEVYQFGRSVAKAIWEIAMIGLTVKELASAVKGFVKSKLGNIAKGVGKSAKADANKLNHIFGKQEHKLGNFLKSHGGDQTKAFNAIQNATQQYVKSKGITGVFEEVINVGGTNITVRGNVIGGEVNIGTAFIP